MSPEPDGQPESRAKVEKRAWRSWASLATALAGVLSSVLGAFTTSSWTSRPDIEIWAQHRLRELAPSLIYSVAAVTLVLFVAQTFVIRLRSRRRLKDREKIYSVVATMRSAYQFALEHNKMNPEWKEQ